MAEYIVDSATQDTETLFVAYREARGNVQAIVGGMYQSIRQAETSYAEFDAALRQGGPLETLGAKQAPINDAVLLLRQSMAGVTAIMEQMQNEYAAVVTEGILFPGVPV